MKLYKSQAAHLTLILIISMYFTNCIYRDIKTPGISTNHTQYILNSDDYQILGTVETEGIYVSWFNLVLTGETGYRDLLDKSKALGGDEIMNYRFDLENKSILLFVWNRLNWKATATAIKYRDKIKK